MQDPGDIEARFSQPEFPILGLGPLCYRAQGLGLRQGLGI